MNAFGEPLPSPSSGGAPAPELLREADRAYLLDLARAAAARALGGEAPAPVSPGSPILRAPGACFVTFKQKHPMPGTTGLRGCLGTMVAKDPLEESVARLAADTVRKDPRFYDNPVRLEELPGLHIDISVLHPPRELRDPLDFELGADGIEMQGVGEYEYGRGVYLPQVATEFGFTKEQFLDSCCSHKAGLPHGAWRDPSKCTVYAFRAEVFGE